MGSSQSVASSAMPRRFSVSKRNSFPKPQHPEATLEVGKVFSSATTVQRIRFDDVPFNLRVPATQPLNALPLSRISSNGREITRVNSMRRRAADGGQAYAYLLNPDLPVPGVMASPTNTEPSDSESTSEGGPPSGAATLLSPASRCTHGAPSVTACDAATSPIVQQLASPVMSFADRVNAFGSPVWDCRPKLIAYTQATQPTQPPMTTNHITAADVVSNNVACDACESMQQPPAPGRLRLRRQTTTALHIGVPTLLTASAVVLALLSAMLLVLAMEASHAAPSSLMDGLVEAPMVDLQHVDLGGEAGFSSGASKKLLPYMSRQSWLELHA